ncbi:hypothetical protein IW262DRAFT_1460656 [Armillaria fumosa]|nr:hypothetical protein IW262DRAFT_1460656 [Armillaria fumosa]
MGNSPSSPFSWSGPARGSAPGVEECFECQERKRNLGFESNVEEWNSTLVIAWISLGMLLLMAGFIRWRPRYRKIMDIESKAFHKALKPSVDEGENIKSQTMIGAVEE